MEKLKKFYQEQRTKILVGIGIFFGFTLCLIHHKVYLMRVNLGSRIIFDTIRSLMADEAWAALKATYPELITAYENTL